MKKKNQFLKAVFCVLCGWQVSAPAQDFSGVPGEVLAYVPLQYHWSYPLTSTPERFVADPEIKVLPNGDYLMSYSLSGRGTTAGTSGVSSLFRSTNGGVSWTSLGSRNGILRGSLFTQGSHVYFFGANHDSSNNTAVLIKSSNDGSTWSAPLSFTTSGPGTPNNPVVWSNRIWIAGGTAIYSAPADADLMDAASWQRKTGFPSATSDWITGSSPTITEGQVVAAPDLGVFILPKVGQYALTALSRIDSSRNVRFDPANNFVDLPGGEKKFGATYDAVSGKFFVLSNPVLPAHEGSSIDAAKMRNTAAVLTSRDLLNWNVEKIFLYSSNERQEGFGYLNFDFDQNDIVVAARSSMVIPGEPAPKPERGGHDTNLLTFHRVPGFRDLVPDHYLSISGNQILRYERTQHHTVPLGSFTLGSTFAGAALTAPNGMGVTAGGDVYIREAGGRILRFDSSGNFIETTGSAPVLFQAASLDIPQPPAGESSWIRSGSGDWSDLLNWRYWRRPDTPDELAVFGSAAGAAATVTVPSATQVWGFNADGNVEGWSVANADWEVSGGWLQGTASGSTQVQISRTDRFFYGASVPEVRVRMKADADCTVWFRWGHTQDDTFILSRRVNLAYTGGGEFQELVIPMAGNPDWDGRAITRLRIELHVQGSPVKGFAVDSITVPAESFRLRGMRFRNSSAYTLAGNGSLTLAANSGEDGWVEVLQGDHRLEVPLALRGDAAFRIGSGTSLRVAGGLDLDGNTLTVSGEGNLTLTNRCRLSGGTLAIEQGSAVTMSRSSGGFDGTLEFSAPENFAPVAGDVFHVIAGDMGTNRFEQVVLPDLPDGMVWDTSRLYSAGNVSVKAVQHPLVIHAVNGTTVPPAGSWMYNQGDDVTLVATADPYYHFSGWSGDAGGDTNSAQMTLTVDRARSVTANFAPNRTANTATPEWWLAQHGLTNFLTDAVTDHDGDGMEAWQEYIAGTDPNSGPSVLRIAGSTASSGGVFLRWPSVSNRIYSISRTANLLEPFLPVAEGGNLPATPPENVFNHTAGDGRSVFYRILVQLQGE